jgi:hypothetical protein
MLYGFKSIQNSMSIYICVRLKRRFIDLSDCFITNNDIFYHVNIIDIWFRSFCLGESILNLRFFLTTAK